MVALSLWVNSEQLGMIIHTASVISWNVLRKAEVQLRPVLFIWMALKRRNTPHNRTLAKAANHEYFRGGTLIISEEKLKSLFAGLDSLDFLPWE